MYYFFFSCNISSSCLQTGCQEKKKGCEKIRPRQIVAQRNCLVASVPRGIYQIGKRGPSRNACVGMLCLAYASSPFAPSKLALCLHWSNLGLKASEVSLHNIHIYQLKANFCWLDPYTHNKTQAGWPVYKQLWPYHFPRISCRVLHLLVVVDSSSLARTLLFLNRIIMCIRIGVDYLLSSLFRCPRMPCCLPPVENGENLMSSLDCHR